MIKVRGQTSSVTLSLTSTTMYGSEAPKSHFMLFIINAVGKKHVEEQIVAVAPVITSNCPLLKKKYKQWFNRNKISEFADVGLYWKDHDD